jgi:hypothetical protein
MNSATASPLTCPSNPLLTSNLRRKIFLQIRSCWNWKCALLSASVRSAVYLIAMARSHNSGKLGIILVEVAYVTLTAGLYAGLQQQALRLRSHFWGNLAVVVGVPGLSQALDWLAHILTHEPIPHRALLTVCIFTLLSALFHLHIMRRGAFLTGHGEHSLLHDFRRIPRLTLGFILWPYRFVTELIARRARAVNAELAA